MRPEPLQGKGNDVVFELCKFRAIDVRSAVEWLKQEYQRAIDYSKKNNVPLIVNERDVKIMMSKIDQAFEDVMV